MGLVPSLLPTKDPESRMSTKEFAKAIPLYFSFLPFNQFAQAEIEWVLEGKEEHLDTDPPGNCLCTLLRLVRLQKQFNNKLYRIRNVQKCQGGCWLVSCLTMGVRVMPTSPVQRSWGWPGGQLKSSLGREQSCSPSRSVPRDRCMGVGPGATAPQVLQLSSVSLHPAFMSAL